MKPSSLSTARLSFSLATALAALLATPVASAAVYHWDSDGTTAGFGSTTGTWGTDAFWTETAAGGSPHSTVATTLATDTVNFGTATVNYGNATVGVAVGGVTATSIVFGVGQTTAVTIGSATGPAITLGGATRSIVVNSTGHTINAPITLSGNSTISFGRTTNAAGAFTLGGAIGGTGNLTFATPAGNASNGNLQTINLGAAGGWSGSTTISTVVTGTSNTVRNSSGAANVLPTNTVLSFASVDGLGSGRSTTYDLNGQDQTLAGLSFTGTLNVRRFLNLNNTGAAATLTINNTADHSFGAATNALSTVSPFPNIPGNARIMGAIALTKNGAGTLSLGGTLSGGATVNAHPYTGATNILGGTLRLFSGGAITASSGITINGSTAKLLQENTVTPIAPVVTLTQGTLTGSGTVNTVNVGNATGGIISNNNGIAGAALTIGALTFDGAATVNTFGNVSAPIVTTSLATNVAGTVTINPSAASWAPGTYDLISYGGGSIGGGGFAQFLLGTVAGATPRQSKLLGDSGTAITLTVGADDSPYWVGDGDGTWNTSSANNWKLNSNNNPTTFLAADNALFNDSATGSGPLTVNIDTADVAPTSTTFDNSTKNYILNSSGTFGIATGSLTKSGTGSLTLNTVNTFTGNTTINGGSLIIGGAGQMGGGTYAGAISNDGSFHYSSSAVQTLGGIVSGTGSITQNGPGNLTLSGANTFSGGLEVKGGTVILGNNTAAGTGTIDFDTGSATSATVQFSGALTGIANPISVSSGSIGTNTVSTVGTGALVLNGAITLSSGTILTVDNSSSNNSTIDLGAGLISGDGGIITTGTSTNSFVFRGANTYTGGTTLGGAGLFIPASSSTGSGAGATDGPYGTGTLTLGSISMRSTNLTDITVGNTLVLVGNLTAVTATSEKTLTFSGPATLTGNRTITSQVGSTVAGKSLRFSGIIGDGGNNFGITKEGSGVLLLSGANTYAGTTTVNAGTLSITDSSALGSTAGATTINGGNGSNSVILSLTGATSGLTIAEPLNFAGNTTGRARLSNDSAQNHTLSGPIDVSSDTNLAQFYSDGSGSITISGDITGTMTNGASFFLRGTSTSSLNRVTGSINLVGNLSKTDGGVWLIGAPGETYTWTDTVAANGTLKMGLADVLPATTIITMGNPTGGSTPTFDLNGFNQTVAGIIYNGEGSATGIRTITSATPAVLTVNNATDSITTGLNSGTNNIVLTGALGITKQGAGKLTLNGVNTYSGDTTVNAGVLSLTKAASPADANTGNNASTVNIAATGATLDLAFTGTDVVDKLFIGGVQQAAGVYGPTATPLAQITNSSGTGTLTVATGPGGNNYSSWAALQVPAIVGGPNGDDDNDGVKNLVEYALADGQERGTLTGSTLSFTKRGAPYGGDLTYAIETSEDLGITDAWSAVTPDLNSPATISYTLQNPGDNFARLKVVQVP